MSSIVVTDFLGRSEKFDEGWQVWAAKIVAASGGFIAVLGGLGLAAAKERTDWICLGREWFGLEKSISFLWVIPGSFVSGLLGAAVWTFLLPLAGSSPAEPADQSGEA